MSGPQYQRGATTPSKTGGLAQRDAKVGPTAVRRAHSFLPPGLCLHSCTSAGSVSLQLVKGPKQEKPFLSSRLSTRTADWYDNFFPRVQQQENRSAQPPTNIMFDRRVVRGPTCAPPHRVASAPPAARRCARVKSWVSLPQGVAPQHRPGAHALGPLPEPGLYRKHAHFVSIMLALLPHGVAGSARAARWVRPTVTRSAPLSPRPSPQHRPGAPGLGTLPYPRAVTRAQPTVRKPCFSCFPSPSRRIATASPRRLTLSDKTCMLLVRVQAGAADAARGPNT